MKKYIVETIKSSTWVWEVMANNEDEAKEKFVEGFVTSKVTDAHLTVKEA